MWRCRRHRIPRKKTTGHLLRRTSDGTLWTAGHGGYADSMASLFNRDNQYWFVRVRKWRGQYVMATRITWVHGNASDHEFVRNDMKKVDFIQLGDFPE